MGALPSEASGPTTDLIPHTREQRLVSSLKGTRLLVRGVRRPIVCRPALAIIVLSEDPVERVRLSARTSRSSSPLWSSAHTFVRLGRPLLRRLQVRTNLLRNLQHSACAERAKQPLRAFSCYLPLGKQKATQFAVRDKHHRRA